MQYTEEKIEVFLLYVYIFNGGWMFRNKLDLKVFECFLNPFKDPEFFSFSVQYFLQFHMHYIQKYIYKTHNVVT